MFGLAAIGGYAVGDDKEESSDGQNKLGDDETLRSGAMWELENDLQLRLFTLANKQFEHLVAFNPDLCNYLMRAFINILVDCFHEGVLAEFRQKGNRWIHELTKDQVAAYGPFQIIWASFPNSMEWNVYNLIRHALSLSDVLLDDALTLFLVHYQGTLTRDYNESQAPSGHVIPVQEQRRGQNSSVLGGLFVSSLI